MDSGSIEAIDWGFAEEEYHYSPLPESMQFRALPFRKEDVLPIKPAIYTYFHEVQE